MNEELWKKIIVLHNTNKALFIWCEDNGVQLKSFLQPNNELKNAWEHVVRAKANELGMTSAPDPEYIKRNLDKVLGHEYRAFFDICDWLSMNLRAKLIELLQPYDNTAINTIIPTYYTEIRPQLDKICNEIAKLRSTKDIALTDDIQQHVNDYNEIIKKLIADLTRISTCVPALEEYKCKNTKVESKGYWREVGLLVIGGVILAFAEWIFSFFSKPTAPH
jgi:hypothetical protein